MGLRCISGLGLYSELFVYLGAKSATLTYTLANKLKN